MRRARAEKREVRQCALRVAIWLDGRRVGEDFARATTGYTTLHMPESEARTEERSADPYAYASRAADVIIGGARTTQYSSRA